MIWEGYYLYDEHGTKKYQFGTSLGTGGFGTVVKATDLNSGKVCAVKIIDINKVRKNEENAMYRLKHPHIVEIYEVFKSPSHMFIAMEYVEGGNMNDRISSGWKVDFLRKWSYKLVDVVLHMHTNNVCHRDLKLLNILCGKAGNFDDFKVTDFGLATIVENDSSLNMTRAGTEAFTAPEILRKKEEDGKSIPYHAKPVDIWSIGVILYKLLTGCLAFGKNGPKNESTINKSLEGVRAKLKKLGENGNDKTALDDLTDLLMHMWDVNPNTRYTIEQVRKHKWLQGVAEVDHIPTSKVPSGTLTIHEVAEPKRDNSHLQSVFDLIGMRKYQFNKLVSSDVPSSSVSTWQCRSANQIKRSINLAGQALGKSYWDKDTDARSMCGTAELYKDREMIGIVQLTIQKVTKNWNIVSFRTEKGSENSDCAKIMYEAFLAELNKR